MRSENAVKNSLSGLGSQFIIILLSFVARSFFNRALSDQFIGYNSLLGNILGLLNLAELGIGSAITFYLYLPLHEANEDKVAGIMHLYKMLYGMIGVVVLIGSLLLTPYLQFFIKDVVVDMQFLQTIFLLYALNTVVSYFYSHKRTLLFASQKSYITMKFDVIAKVVTALLQIVILVNYRDEVAFVAYLVIGIVVSFVFNVWISRICDKEFPYLKDNKCRCSKEERHDIFKNLKYLSLTRIAAYGVNNTDSIIISKYISSMVLGIYSNYQLLFASISTLFVGLLRGVVASFGDLLVEKDQWKIRGVFEAYTFVTYLIVSFSCVSFALLTQPFILLWLGNASKWLNDQVVVLLIVVFFVNLVKTPFVEVLSSAGVFKEILPYSLIEVVLNLVISITLAKSMGIAGVFIGTIVSGVVSWIGLAYLCHKLLMNQSSWHYWRTQGLQICLILIEVMIAMMVASPFSEPTFVNFIVKMGICLVVPNLVNILLFHRNPTFIRIKSILIKR